MNYNLMEPPFSYKPFVEMNKKEAQEYFNWFINEIPNRVILLRKAYEINNVDIGSLDYTPLSLINLWKWFIPKIKTVNLTKNELKEYLDKIPEWARGTMDNKKLSVETLAIAIDIAIYFAETVRKNKSNIQWGLITKPKSFYSVNKPILIGFNFGLDLDAMLLLNNISWEVVKGNSSIEALYQLYQVWVDK
jgi:hypothetical protein